MRRFLDDIKKSCTGALISQAVVPTPEGLHWTVTTVGATFAGVAFRHAIRALEASHEMPPQFSRRSKTTRFLNENPMDAIETYWSEATIAPSLPYVEVANFVDLLSAGKKPEIELDVAADLFSLQRWDTTQLNDLSSAGVQALSDEGRYSHDSNIVRVSGISRTPSGARMSIQQARYDDQARSNLILDFAAGGAVGTRTIRQRLHADYGPLLPLLSDRRLANTLGCAAMIFSLNGKDIVPFVQLRSRDVAVWSTGGWHCTASGAAEWPEDPDTTPKTLEAYITDDMYRELEQEAGLGRNDVKLEPVAICREMVRAGKPQLFYLGYTDLSFRELARRSETARKQQVKARQGNRSAEPVETMKRPYLHEPRLFQASDEVDLHAFRYGFTNEAAACLHYFFRLAEAAS